jgi:hypothetical protein
LRLIRQCVHIRHVVTSSPDAREAIRRLTRCVLNSIKKPRCESGVEVGHTGLQQLAKTAEKTHFSLQAAQNAAQLLRAHLLWTLDCLKSLKNGMSYPNQSELLSWL